jgi:hypothetical protein
LIIVLKSGPARRVNPGPTNPGLEPGRIEEKIEEEKIGEGKTQCDSADPARPSQKLY